MARARSSQQAWDTAVQVLVVGGSIGASILAGALTGGLGWVAAAATAAGAAGLTAVATAEYEIYQAGVTEQIAGGAHAASDLYSEFRLGSEGFLVWAQRNLEYTYAGSTGNVLVAIATAPIPGVGGTAARRVLAAMAMGGLDGLCGWLVDPRQNRGDFLVETHVLRGGTAETAPTPGQTLVMSVGMGAAFGGVFEGGIAGAQRLFFHVDGATGQTRALLEDGTDVTGEVQAFNGQLREGASEKKALQTFAEQVAARSRQLKDKPLLVPVTVEPQPVGRALSETPSAAIEGVVFRAEPLRSEADPIGAMAEYGIGLAGRPDPVVIHEALNALKAGNATPDQQKVLLLEIVADARQFIVFGRIAEKKKPDAPYWSQMSQACGLGRDCAAASLSALAESGSKPVAIDRFQAKAAFGFGGHSFLVVTFPDGSRHLVDPTFVQFLGKPGERLRRGAANIRGALTGDPRAEELAAMLARDGTLPLNEETAAFYVRSMAATQGKEVDTSALPDLTGRLLHGPGTEASERAGAGEPGVAFDPLPDKPEMETRETLLELAENHRGALKRQTEQLEDPDAKTALEKHIQSLEQLINRIEDRSRTEVTTEPPVEAGSGSPQPLTRAELEAAVAISF